MAIVDINKSAAEETHEIGAGVTVFTLAVDDAKAVVVNGGIYGSTIIESTAHQQGRHVQEPWRLSGDEPRNARFGRLRSVSRIEVKAAADESDRLHIPRSWLPRSDLKYRAGHGCHRSHRIGRAWRLATISRPAGDDGSQSSAPRRRRAGAAHRGARGLGRFGARGCFLAQASILSMTGLTALYALDIAALKNGQVLAVSGGAGLLAQYAIAAAKRQGIKVIADARPADAELVHGYGADIVIERGPGFAGRSAGSCPMVPTRCSTRRTLGKSPGAPSVTGVSTFRFAAGQTARRAGNQDQADDGTDVLERTEWLELLRNMVAAGEIKLRAVEEFAATNAADCTACARGR